MVQALAAERTCDQDERAKLEQRLKGELEAVIFARCRGAAEQSMNRAVCRRRACYRNCHPIATRQRGKGWFSRERAETATSRKPLQHGHK
jgi:hypothetical protein